MLPTDNAKRMLLQQHLLQRSLTQQLAAANVRQLQTPSTMGSGASAAGQSSYSAIHQVAAAAVAMGRDVNRTPSAVPANKPLTANLLLRLLNMEQENQLKRRIEDLQQQRQLQQQQQHRQQILLASTQGRIERPNTTNVKNLASAFGSILDSSQNTSELLASLQQNHQKIQIGATSMVPSIMAKPSSSSLPAKAPVQQGIEQQDPIEKRAPAAVTASTSTGGVSRKDARWKEMYQELLTYKGKTGSCTVPRGYPENPRLASWVAEQRKQYKLMKDGRQSSITTDRVALLNQVEFAWNAQEAAWEKHMRDLKSFRSNNGHTHCQLGDPKYPKLGLWVKEQRRHYTLMKQGKQSHMTEARCIELDSVGFCWDTHEATWLERLNELRAFKSANGNCVVPTNYPENPKLGTWIHHQRRQYKKFKETKPCHITAERIRALDSLGFVWHPRDKRASPPGSPVGAKRVVVSDADLTNLDLRPRKRQRM